MHISYAKSRKSIYSSCSDNSTKFFTKIHCYLSCNNYTIEKNEPMYLKIAVGLRKTIISMQKF